MSTIARSRRLFRHASLEILVHVPAARGAMERLRAHAIRHRRGFTRDAEIHPLGASRRWI
jgi:hypothetical protein